MVALEPGAIALVPFPFSDLTQSKLRPAVLLADAGRDDWILCQVTSQSWGDVHAVLLRREDVVAGQLHIESFARPAKLFIASSSLIVGAIGTLRPIRLQELIDVLVHLLRRGRHHRAA